MGKQEPLLFRVEKVLPLLEFYFGGIFEDVLAKLHIHLPFDPQLCFQESVQVIIQQKCENV